LQWPTASDDDGRMSPSPRRLTFAVGTSLLTASLATIACADKNHVNVRAPEIEEHVNEGPEPEQPAPDETPAPEDDVDGTDGPEQLDPETEEPRTVNTRQADPK
jgi:hypothetical protein